MGNLGNLSADMWLEERQLSAGRTGGEKPVKVKT
jgi:hypothetical protein